MIGEKQTELFDRWQSEQGYPYFIKDGVFDEKTWNGEPLKITFILKDANWPNANENLCDHVLNGHSPTIWKTWNNIARWTQALLEGGEYPWHLPEEERSRLLRRVSFLNLKKTGGGRGAKPKEIRAAAQNDAAYIREQLLLYKPDLIICCGKWLVSDILAKEVLQNPRLSPIFPVQDREEAEDGTQNFYTRFPGKECLTPVVDFCHPEWIEGGHPRYQEDFQRMKSLRKTLLPPVL